MPKSACRGQVVGTPLDFTTSFNIGLRSKSNLAIFETTELEACSQIPTSHENVQKPFIRSRHESMPSAMHFINGSGNVEIAHLSRWHLML
jgi:hypothetical protein